jgi:hypothetical protein
VLDIPDSATAIALGGTIAGKGMVWFDDFALEVVGNDVATTGARVSGQPHKQQPGPFKLPAELTNADFER